MHRASRVSCVVITSLQNARFPLAHASSRRVTYTLFGCWPGCVRKRERVWVAVGVCGCTRAEYRARAPGRLKSGGHCTRELALTHGRAVAAATETYAYTLSLSLYIYIYIYI